MLLSVIIPTYNRAKYISQALTSLQKQNCPAASFEVIVVDDGSTDKTSQVVKGFLADFSLSYIADKHQGVSHARNLGIRASHGEVLVFFDDDALADADWLKNIAAIMQTEKIITGKILPRQTKFWSYFAPHYNQGSLPTESPVLLEGNCAISREVFKRVGVFDENLDYGHEGKEFIARCRQYYKIMYYPQVLIFHDYASGLGRYLWKQFKFGEKLAYLKIKEIKSLLALMLNYQAWWQFGEKIRPNELVEQLSLIQKIPVKIIGRLGRWSHFYGSVFGYLKYKNRYAKS